MMICWYEARYAVRVLRKTPAFTITVVLTIALAIGANTAAFTVVYAALLRPLPYTDQERLVVAAPLAPGVVLDWRAASSSFTSIAAFLVWDVDVTDAGKPDRVSAAVATTNIFETLGVRPVLGRGFASDDEDTVVISEGYWRRRFGEDSSVVGRSLSVNGRPHVIIGVMPDSVRFPATVALWVPPRHLIPEYPLDPTADPTQNRGAHYLGVVARLKPGVALGAARAEQRTIFERLIARYPSQMVPEDAEVALIPLREWLSGDLRSPLLSLLGVVGVILLLACANVVNLLLSRSVSRARELHVRAALGASRARLAMHVLTECALLAGAGGLCGLLASWWTLPWLLSLSPHEVSEVDPATGVPTILFAAAISSVALALVGVAPVWQLFRAGGAASIRHSGRGATAGPADRKWRNGLAALECAASVALLIMAGLLIRSFISLRAVNPGFTSQDVYAARIVLPPERYATAAAQARLFDRVLDEVRVTPGVSAVAAAARLPFIDGDSVRGIELDSPTSGVTPDAGIRVISPAYFLVMQQPVRRGRVFTERDTSATLRVAIVNEAFGRRYWPGRDPVGRRLRIASGGPWLEVVGVVGDVKHATLREPIAPEFYVPYAQLPWSFMTIVVRTQHLAAASTAITHAIEAADPLLPLPAIHPMTELISASLAMDAFETTAVSVLAGIALALGMVGLYGVLSYNVSRRTAEFALRIAIGAAPSDITQMVLAEASRVIGLGVIAGAVAGVFGERVIRASLFGVGALDPWTFGLAIVSVTGVALAAAYGPARRARMVDPVRAMSSD